MNKELIINEINKLKIDKSEFIKNLGKKVADIYIVSFPIEVINELDYKNMDTKKITRLNLDILSEFTEEERSILAFNDVNKISINQNSYMLVDLKGNVVEFVKNNKKVLLDRLIDFEELIDSIAFCSFDVSINYKAIKNYKLDMYLKSLIYNYAYTLLLEQARFKTDLVRAGMFKNAYFDIIQISEKKLNSDLNSKRSV